MLVDENSRKITVETFNREVKYQNILTDGKKLNHDININETTKGLNTVITQIFEGVNDTVFSLEKCLVVIT